MTHRNRSLFRSPPWPGSRARAVLLIAGVLLAGRVGAFEPIKTYSTLLLKDGRLLSSVQVVSYTSSGLLVRHSAGATTLRTDVLPERVIAELHLPSPQWGRSPSDAFASLADKVAVADPESTRAPIQPATGSESPALPELAHAEALPSTPSATLAPDGEGELPTAMAREAARSAPASGSKWITFAGRVAVALPSGKTHLLSDVEVRAYPADLLARYLDQARAKSASLAQQFRDQAIAAAREGRVAESAALIARATKTAEQYLDLLPEAPFVARSDPYGYFTLRHDLPSLRLVAVGRVQAQSGEWTYAWVGVTLGEDAQLTEANATSVSAPTANGPRLAAQ